jgi:hypothetical protein
LKSGLGKYLFQSLFTEFEKLKFFSSKIHHLKWLPDDKRFRGEPINEILIFYVPVWGAATERLILQRLHHRTVFAEFKESVIK